MGGRGGGGGGGVAFSDKNRTDTETVLVHVGKQATRPSANSVQFLSCCEIKFYLHNYMPFIGHFEFVLIMGVAHN